MQPAHARYLHDSDGTNADRYRCRVGRRVGAGSMVDGDSKAAARRWTQLRARIRVARSLRHSSQNRLLPSRQNSDLWRSSAATANRLEPTKNRQTVGHSPNDSLSL